jgi:Ser/Thr protein kinase RdoA (MazF antagonist)
MSDLTEIHRSVGRIEGKLDALAERFEAHDTAAGQVEARVRTVENRQHWYSGAGAVLGAVLGAFGVHLKGI